MPGFLILPTQLFEIKHLKKIPEYDKYTYIIWEHPHYFRKYRYNKKKILLHRASCVYYAGYLKKNGFTVKHIAFDCKPPKYDMMFDPIDKIKLLNVDILDSPGFMFTHEMCEDYRKKTNKFFFNAFYMWGKKQLDIIPKLKSHDKENRGTYDGRVQIPRVPSNRSDMKYIQVGAKLANKFKRNYGNTDNFMFPVTHSTAQKFLRHFLLKRFKYFGKYQDAICHKCTNGDTGGRLTAGNVMFHSIISSSMNIGLLTPLDVVDAALAVKGIPTASLEGFIRQLFWREYQRYCYEYGFSLFRSNYFGNRKPLTPAWYTGKLGIPPVDDAIIEAFDTGYLHHIKRLMVVGNFMNLNGISPKAGYKWFMEFSCDSYDWVMHQNVLDMVFFVTGGKTMRRPYVSSSNYIKKMSDYSCKCKDKEDSCWCDHWDDLYQKFVKSKRAKLKKFRYYFKNITFSS